MVKLLTRRELAQQALAGTTGAALAFLALPARAQVVDPQPTAPPPLPLSPKPTQNVFPMPTQSTQTPETTPGKPTNEGTLLIQLVPITAVYTLSETQAKEVAGQLKDYPGGFAKARAYVLPDDIGPAFAATAPTRKERTR